MAPTARIGGPQIVVRAKDQTVGIYVYDGATVASVTESGSTYTLYDPNSEVVVTGGISVESDGQCTFQIAAGDVPETLSLRMDYLTVWSIIIGGTAYPFELDTVLAIRGIQAHVTEADLLVVCPDLAAQKAPSQTSWTEQIDAAFQQLERRLIGDGRRPELIISSWALFDVHVLLSLGNICRLLETYSAGKGKWSELKDQFFSDFEDAYGRLNFRYYDTAETGKPADADSGDAAVPVIFLTGIPGVRQVNE